MIKMSWISQIGDFISQIPTPILSTIFSAIIIPVLWYRFGGKYKKNQTTSALLKILHEHYKIQKKPNLLDTTDIKERLEKQEKKTFDYEYIKGLLIELSKDEKIKRIKKTDYWLYL